MSNYNEYVVERVAKAIWDSCEAVVASRFPFTPEPWEDATNMHEDFRKHATAALDAIDSLYESEADEPVEVVS